MPSYETKESAATSRQPVERLSIQRRTAIQRTSAIQQKNASTLVLQDNRASIQRQPNNTGLPDNLKTGMEHISGMNMDSVRVHYNSSKPAAVQAHAFAQGHDIHLGAGQETHLPHELGHVVQQAQGRVTPTTSVNGMAVNDSPQLESEATEMGKKALQMQVREIASDAD